MEKAGEIPLKSARIFSLWITISAGREGRHWSPSGDRGGRLPGTGENVKSKKGLRWRLGLLVLVAQIPVLFLVLYSFLDNQRTAIR